ncbi:MAG: hypothetical protein AAF851_22890 [Myxococcota bacterium]
MDEDTKRLQQTYSGYTIMTFVAILCFVVFLLGVRFAEQSATEARERAAALQKAETIRAQLEAQRRSDGSRLSAPLGAVESDRGFVLPDGILRRQPDRLATSTVSITVSGPSPNRTLDAGTGECSQAVFFVEVPLENTPIAIDPSSLEAAMTGYINAVDAMPRGPVWFGRPAVSAPTFLGEPGAEVDTEAGAPAVKVTRVLQELPTSPHSMRADGHDRAFRVSLFYPRDANGPETLATVSLNAVPTLIWKLRQALRTALISATGQTGPSLRTLMNRYRVGTECSFRGLSSTHPFGALRETWHKRALAIPRESELLNGINDADQAIIELLDSGIDDTYIETRPNVVLAGEYLEVIPGGDDEAPEHPHAKSLLKLIESIAPNMEVRIRRVMDSDGLGHTASLARALDEAWREALGQTGRDRLPTIINMSLGWPREHTHLSLEERAPEYYDPITDETGQTRVDGIGEVIRYLLAVIEAAEPTSELTNRIPAVTVVAAAGNRPDPVGRGLGSLFVTLHNTLKATLTTPFIFLPPHYRRFDLQFSQLPLGMRYDPVQNLILGRPPQGPFDIEIAHFDPVVGRRYVDLIQVNRSKETSCLLERLRPPRHSWFYPAAYQRNSFCSEADYLIPVGGIADDFQKAVLTPHDVEPQIVAPGQWVFAGHDHENGDPLCSYIPDDEGRVDLPPGCFPQLVSGTSAAAALVSTAIALRQSRLQSRGMPPERRANVRRSLLKFGTPVPRSGISVEDAPRLPHITRMFSDVTTYPDADPLRSRGGEPDGSFIAATPNRNTAATPIPTPVPEGGPDRYSLGIIGPKPDQPTCPACFAVPGSSAIEVYLQLEPGYLFDFGGVSNPAPRIRVDNVIGWSGPAYFDVVLPPGWSGPAEPFWQTIPLDPSAQCSSCEFRLEAGVREPSEAQWSWEVGPINRTF